MNILSSFITILGLSLFEVISSVDNAIINAEVLSTMKEKYRRWFLSWGLLFAVVVVRGLLPLLIVWMVNPTYSPGKVLGATITGDETVIKSIEASAPLLLMGGGVFMVFVFFHWLFLEHKEFGLPGERFISRQGVWFYAVVSLILSLIVWHTLPLNPYLAFSAVVGSTAFFILHGFRQNAELAEKNLMKAHMSDISKILYLEVIDTTFSIDGVLGSFAFTLSVPLILLGNGLGAFILRELTVKNVDRIRNYKFLKNGAMYSILFLGAIMVADAFNLHIPPFISPVITFAIVGYFFLKSK